MIAPLHNGSWSKFDLLGRPQEHIEPCSDDGVLGWALKHAKVTVSEHDARRDE